MTSINFNKMKALVSNEKLLKELLSIALRSFEALEKDLPSMSEQELYQAIHKNKLKLSYFNLLDELDFFNSLERDIENGIEVKPAQKKKMIDVIRPLIAQLKFFLDKELPE